MTWFSFLTRSLGIILVVPLITSRYEPPEIALWYLFTTVLALNQVIDMGFAPTFVRVISYCMGGATVDEISIVNKKRATKNRAKNWKAIDDIFSCMQYIYNRITILAFIVLTIITIFMIRPIYQTENIFISWLGWVLIFLGMLILIRGSVFAIYIQGLNKVALLKKWDGIFGICQILSNATVIYIGGNLLMLVLSNLFWMIVVIPRNKFIALQLEKGAMLSFKKKVEYDPVILKVVWSSAWRSGLGSLMVMGLLRLSNIVYAQFAESYRVASYLVSYDLLKQLSRFSQAPIYSKLPLLAKLRYEGDIERLKLITNRGMKFCLWIIVFGAILGYIALPNLLEFTDSNIKLVEPLLWSLIAIAMLVERYVGIHTQIYSTTNHIIWHITSAITGVLYIIFVVAGFHWLDVYILPLAIIIANLCFSAWYVGKLSYNSLNTNFFSFEKKTSIPVIIFSIVALIIVIL